MATKTRKFRKVSTAGHSSDMEIITTKSQTTPDMSLTVRELMDRFASGTLGDLELEYDYNEDDEDFRGLDPSEIYDEVQRGNLLAREAKEALDKANAGKARAKLENEIREQIALEQKSKEDA